MSNTRSTIHWSTTWLAAATGGLLAAVLGLALLAFGGCASSCRPSPPPVHDAGAGSGSGSGEAGVPIDATPIDATPIDSTPIADAVVIDSALPATDASGHVGGSFSVAINTGLATNCTRAGADIAEFAVVLIDGSGACVPTLVHLVGGSPVLPEARSLCPSSPARFPCFESEILVTAQGLAPGGYHLVIDGVVGGRTCWKGDASLGISDTPDDHVLTLLRQDGC